MLIVLARAANFLGTPLLEAAAADGGAVLGSFEAWLLLRGMDVLAQVLKSS